MKAENEHLKNELERSSELVQIRMNRIFQLCDELEEANTRCSKLQDMIYEATDLIDDALRTDDVYGMYDKLNEIKNVLEG